MDNHYTINVQAKCKNLGGILSSEFCLPLVELCDPTPRGLVTDCDATWNCNLCKLDKAYWVPYQRGDKIQLQTLFFDYYNSDREDPDTGWGPGGSSFVTAQLRDNNNNVISSTLTDFASRMLVGWNGTNSYQILEIDTSKAVFDSLDCWSIFFRSYDQDNFEVQTLCSQHFAERSCDSTVQIKGTFSSFDCQGLYYGDPVEFVGDEFKYDNTLRYYGALVDRGSRVNKTVVRNSRTSIERVRTHTLAFERLLPPYMKNLLADQHVGAARFYIDGTEYTRDNFEITNDIDRSNMFKIEMDVEEVCELKDGC